MTTVAGIDLGLARRLDRSGPRYTSYPTALEFHEGVDGDAYAAHLRRADEAAPGKPLGLYVHIPFCAELCTFCACHVIPARQPEAARGYVAAVGREIARLAAHLPRRRRLAQMHWGGGTPTYLTPAELRELFAAVARWFAIAPDAELAIEIDPRVTTREHLETLKELGFDRLSMGVQDFTPEVQEAIGRRQTFDETRELFAAARALGFGAGINVDLVYGLPRQTVAAFAHSLERVLELRPERIAMYSFAFVPWSRPHQKRLDTAALPDRETKLRLHLLARERLLAGGYLPIGIDHFALPGDELAVAAGAGRLERNFMGYSTRASPTLIAAGVSGISEVAGAYFQNERKLSAYYAALDEGRLPIQRGYVLDDDDRLRQRVIRDLMCAFAVDRERVGAEHAIDFERYFAAERSALAALERESDVRLIDERGARLELTPEGRLFVRNVCMVFDRYLAPRGERGQPAYSRTV